MYAKLKLFTNLWGKKFQWHVIYIGFEQHDKCKLSWNPLAAKAVFGSRIWGGKGENGGKHEVRNIKFTTLFPYHFLFHWCTCFALWSCKSDVCGVIRKLTVGFCYAKLLFVGILVWMKLSMSIRSSLTCRGQLAITVQLGKWFFIFIV